MGDFQSRDALTGFKSSILMIPLLIFAFTGPVSNTGKL